jgi:hypothetical protein
VGLCGLGIDGLTVAISIYSKIAHAKGQAHLSNWGFSFGLLTVLIALAMRQPRRLSRKGYR